MCIIRQEQWLTGRTRMETAQVHYQTAQEVYTHGKPRQTQVIKYFSKFRNGYQVPRNYAKAIHLDENGNSKLNEAIHLE
jgi:hypothetical protein